MPAPTLVKTWQHNVNQFSKTEPSYGDNYRDILLFIKDALLGFSGTSWSVVGSCDKTNYNLTGSDFWTGRTALTWATGTTAKSWIVLKNTGLGANWQLLLYLTGASSPYYWQLLAYVSPSAGFTGGTPAARPTATDEVQLRDAGSGAGWYAGYTTALFSPVVHVMRSTDGKCTRVAICYNGTSYGCWMFEEMVNVPAALTTPWLAVINSYSDDNGYWRYLDYNDTAQFKGRYGTTNYTAFLTSDFYGSAAVGQNLSLLPQELTNEWPFSPMGVVSETTGVRGRIGTLVDIWWGSSYLQEGVTYPNDDSRQFVQFGNIILPWNGSVPRIR